MSTTDIINIIRGGSIVKPVEQHEKSGLWKYTFTTSKMEVVCNVDKVSSSVTVITCYRIG